MRAHLYRKESVCWQHSNACWCREDYGEPTAEESRTDFFFHPTTEYKWFDIEADTLPLEYTSRRRKEIIDALDDLFTEDATLVMDWVEEMRGA